MQIQRNLLSAGTQLPAELLLAVTGCVTVKECDCMNAKTLLCGEWY